MKAEGFFERETGTWSYLLGDEAAGKAALIDPVWEYDPVSGETSTAHIDSILAVAEARGWTITHVLETHAHADHLSGADRVRRRCGAAVFAGREIRSVQAHFAARFNLEGFRADGSQFDGLLSEGDVLQIGGLAVRVLETPGHTRDSLTFLAEDAAFVGDTLFAPQRGTARCDFPGGDPGELFDSIARLHALPEETRLFLCHDYPENGEPPVCCIRVAESRRHNAHARDDVERDAFIRQRRQRDAALPLPRLIYPALQVNIRGGRAPRAETNGQRYLRIPFGEARPRD